MAKKKSTKKKPIQRDKGKTRFEVRFDEDVCERLRTLADDAQISVNQLLHALARWAVQNPHLGDPKKDSTGFIERQTGDSIQPGAIWWGKPGSYVQLSGEERKAFEEGYLEHYGCPPEPHECTKRHENGEVYLHLDFTERRVVRED